MQITILIDKFYALQKLMTELKYVTNRTNSVPIRDSNHLYVRQQRRRKERQQLFLNDPRFGEFFAWIADLQKRLKLNNTQFGALCGVSRETVTLWMNWKTSGGIFPSKKAVNKLMRLEIICQSTIKITKNKTNVKDKRFKTSKVTMPKLKIKGRKRLSANVYY